MLPAVSYLLVTSILKAMHDSYACMHTVSNCCGSDIAHVRTAGCITARSILFMWSFEGHLEYAISLP
jgi:hypothetical protein